MDREAWKIIVENGGKHPASLTSLLYLPREKGGRGLQSVEHEYKITKIKSLLKLYQNSDQTVGAVREFEEHTMASGYQSLVKEAAKYAEELNITLQLDILNPVCVTTEGKESTKRDNYCSVDKIKHSDLLMKLYTGIDNYDLFEWIYNQVKEKVPFLQYYKGPDSQTQEVSDGQSKKPG